MSLVFPSPRGPETVVTPTIKETLTRLFAVHQKRGQMAVMTGKSGAGKTTAALYIEQQVNEAFDSETPQAFRAKYYVATDLRRYRDALLQRRLIAEFARQVLNLSTPQDVRAIDVGATMSAIARGLRLSNLQLVLVDEAGHLPPAALDHLVTLINVVATSEQHSITVALVGMHDLPTNVLHLPQVARRVSEFIYFEPYDAATALTVLRTIHEYFTALDINSQEGQEVMEFLLSQEVSDGGLIGLMVPLVERAAVHAKHLGIPFGLRALRLAYTLKNTDAQRGRADMERRWAVGK